MSPTKSILALATLATMASSLSAVSQVRPNQPPPSNGSGRTDSGKPNHDPNRPGQYVPPPNYGNGGNHGGGHHGGGGHGGGGYYPRPRPPVQPPPYNPPPYYPPRPVPPPYNPPPYYPPPAPPYYPPAPVYGQRIVRTVYVGRSLQNEMFPLSYISNLSAYYGWQIASIRATSRPIDPYQTVVSLVDSYRTAVATQVNPGYQISLYPNRYLTVDSRDLFLQVQGSLYVDQIEIELVSR